MSSIENHILETLSFFDPMTAEQIILDFDEKILLEFPEFTKNELFIELARLENLKIIKVIKQNGEDHWIKCYKKRKKWYQFF